MRTPIPRSWRAAPSGPSAPGRSPVRIAALIAVAAAGALAQDTAGGVAHQAYVKASNTGAGDEFGSSVSISGDTMVVGAALEDSNATGVNGDQTNNASVSSGAAYVFVRTPGSTTWTLQAYLKASNTRPSGLFGAAVAISGDTIVVGSMGESSSATGVNGNQADTSAVNAGAAYVFVRAPGGSTWTQQAYLKASNTTTGDLFGFAVAISGDTIVVGSSSEDSSATGVGGNESDNSASAAGAAYVFVRTPGGSSWSQQAYLKASNAETGDEFGRSVALSGDTIVVGAVSEDSNATGVNGNQADNSASSAGAGYVFTRSAGVWSQQAYLKASNTGADDDFGARVSVSADTVVIGASGEDSNATGVNGNQASEAAFGAGAAYVFVRPAGGSSWTQQAYLKASNTGNTDFFGTCVAVSGNMIAVAALGERSAATGINGNQADNTAVSAGAAYVFMRSAGVWSQQAYVKASNTAANDHFGEELAISAETVVVTAILEDSNATGVNGNGADNSATDSGAAYVYFSPDPCLFTRPTITLQPSGQSVLSGTAANFSVAATTQSDLAPLSYQWRRNGVTLADGGPVFGAATATLTINPATLADNAAAFDCMAINSCGAALSSPAGLSVTSAPTTSGACCLGATCTPVNGAAECTGGGVYLGDGTVCSPQGHGGVFNACCRADFNASGSPSVGDLFAFLAAFFAGCP